MREERWEEDLEPERGFHDRSEDAEIEATAGGADDRRAFGVDAREVRGLALLADRPDADGAGARRVRERLPRAGAQAVFAFANPAIGQELAKLAFESIESVGEIFAGQPIAGARRLDDVEHGALEAGAEVCDRPREEYELRDAVAAPDDAAVLGGETPKAGERALEAGALGRRGEAGAGELGRCPEGAGLRLGLDDAFVGQRGHSERGEIERERAREGERAAVDLAPGRRDREHAQPLGRVGSEAGPGDDRTEERGHPGGRGEDDQGLLAGRPLAEAEAAEPVRDVVPAQRSERWNAGRAGRCEAREPGRVDGRARGTPVAPVPAAPAAATESPSHHNRSLRKTEG